jgi:type I restriction-modification system DNA methylase subunit
MINRQQLLADLQKFLQRIEADLLERSESTEVPEVPAALHAEYEKAAKAERTAQNYEDWRTDTITQAAAAWVLSCVFVRFLEDNSLIDPPKIAGPGERLDRARDEHELYFRSHPQHTDREYLLSIFDELAKLPGTKDIFGEHNAINDLPNWLSGDAAGELLNFFQKIDASTGELVHDFTDPNWDTRFLGDLYQDLSEAARKKFALLQTPDFVEEFILDRTLEPAVEEFGLVPQPSSTDPQSPTQFKMIDPACGSGHFLLGAFPRLLDRWQRKEPGTNIRELTQRSLDSIHGVDINPFAVAIARFRLLLVAMKACDEKKLQKGIPPFRINVACGDSLLHGENRTSSGQKLWDYAEGANDEEMYTHAYPGEDLQTVRQLLRPNSYHCVVANPPYIVASDPKLNAWYRKRFLTCHRQYSLAAPFLEQIFLLAANDAFTGQITANSFMNNEYGKKLVESFLPTIDLTHIVDTRYLQPPGHDTPTVILLGRSRNPMSSDIRVAMGIRGESPTPPDLRSGAVWTSIVKQIDTTDSESDYISVKSIPRNHFKKHPWSISGGEAKDASTSIENACGTRLSELVLVIGRTTHTGEDPAFVFKKGRDRTYGLNSHTVPIVTGGDVRDFRIDEEQVVLFPYDKESGEPLSALPVSLERHFWKLRTRLRSRKDFGQTVEERGLRWFDHSMFFPERYRSKLSLVFAFKATHNHFVFDRGGRVFNRPAPAIIFKESTSAEERFGVFAILNSSVAAFWEREVHRQVAGAGEERWEVRLERNATKYKSFPLPSELPHQLGRFISELAAKWDECLPSSDLINCFCDTEDPREVCANASEYLSQLIAAQEELDWQAYSAYGFVSNELVYPGPIPSIQLGTRAFEIALARKLAAGEARSAWFERHSTTPTCSVPENWPDDYKEIVQRRLELIATDPLIAMMEQPEFKRRWNIENWESLFSCALKEWLLNRLESFFDYEGRLSRGTTHVMPNGSLTLSEIGLYSLSQLADAARQDPYFLKIAAMYRDDMAFDVQVLVNELVVNESVPALPVLCYAESGLRKLAEWNKSWALQRSEDIGTFKGELPLPPKFSSADYLSSAGANHWDSRNELDIHQERWISFPHCEGPDGTLVICWAGYDHLQQAQAISAYYVRVQTEFGGSDDPRLIPLLASLIELLPWLKQWHNEPNANFDGLRMGDYFEGFVNEEARNLGKTLAEIKSWVPPAKGQRGRVAKGQSGKKVAKAKRGKGSKGQSDEGAEE